MSANTIGWQISVFTKQFFLSKTRLNVIGSVISLPFIYNWFSTGKKIYDTKKTNGGKIKIKPADAGRMFGLDLAVMVVGLSAYMLLKSRAGLSITAKTLDHASKIKPNLAQKINN
eukprot:TRINITY_DN2511_c0_g1_i1.p1 TRINITY_DN2511_c0_g1~~TRINITY_DN2511_c0_g1_i1.p1  ORF type:complete len:115 (+),score=11.73 TRINITY_DN2511_c0_g1_i1:106-450(+)